MSTKWKLLQPIQVGSKLFKNRIVMAPMETRLSNPDGSSTKEMAAYYAERARGGAAAIIVENTFVDGKASRSSLASSGLYTDQFIAGKFLISEAIHENGSLAILQISHGGRQANAGATGLPAKAPSAIPCKVTNRIPEPLTIKEIIEIEDAFAQAARRAKQAGFDGVEIHGAHGYLICSFLSPYTNKRTDHYGGSLENRGRFARNIINKIRREVGYDFIVGFRISGAEFVEGGLTIEESCKFVQSIEDKIDYVHVSAGNYETMANWMIMPLYIPQAPIVHLAAEMKKAVKIPVIAVGALDAELGEKALQDGKADLIAYGRALIADPELPRKINENRVEDIRPCFRGHEGCISLFFAGCPIRCEVNPQCGKELDYKLVKTGSPRNVVVIGGGIAGMEAARLAAEMGHKVTLIEKTNKLGGHFIEASAPEFKKEAKGMLEWLIRQVNKNDIKIEFNIEASRETVSSYEPDVVIIAIGSKYRCHAHDGSSKAILPDEALMYPEKTGNNVAVIGGGLIGSETALTLANHGKKVTIVEMLDDIALDHEPLSYTALKYQLEKAGVTILTNRRVTKMTDEGIGGIDLNGSEFSLPADTIVSALGLKARKKEAEAFYGIAPQTFAIGDCVEARKVYHCFHEAWNAVFNIK